MPTVSMPNNLRAIRNAGVGHCGPKGVDDEAELIADYEDSTRASRPSDGGSIPIDDEIIDRFVDIMIVKLTRKKVSLRNLAKIFNVSHVTIRNRLVAIPPQVRRHYEQVQVG